MRQILLRLLEDEKIDSVFKVVQSTWKDLSCIEIYYVKAGVYFVSRSFCTDTWVSSQPFGPMLTDEGYMIVHCLQDVAEIFEYVDAISWRQHRQCTEDNLSRIYQYFDSYAQEFVEKTVGFCSNQVSGVKFMLTPMPMVVITLMHKSILLGSISIDLNGNARVLTATVPSVIALVNQINMKVKPMYKEIAYGCEQNKNC